MKKIISILIIIILIFTSIVIAKPTPNTENMYYIFGDNTNAIPIICFNWSGNETYLYPFNQSIYYKNESGNIFDLANITGGGSGFDGFYTSLDFTGTTGLSDNIDNDTTDTNWDNLTNVPSGFADNIDNDTTDTNWDNLTNVPSGFADGIDNVSTGGFTYSDWFDQKLNTTKDVEFVGIECNNLSYSGNDIFWINISSNYFYINQGFTKPSMQIDTSGIVSFPYQSTCKVYRSSAQSLSAGGGFTKIIWNAEIFDNNNDHSTVTGRFTAPAYGFYQVNYHVEVGGFGVGNSLHGYIYKNGVSYGGYDEDFVSSTTYRHIQGSDVIECSASDYIEIYASTVGGFGLRPVSSNSKTTYMSIVKVG